jgi:hypothetical protein
MVTTRRGQTYDFGIITLSIITVTVALFFWNSTFLLPVKTFVVFLHELSHGLAAILTGGSVEQLRLVEDEGGLAFTRGGNQILIASAGYVGSALWGALLMRLAWHGPRLRQYAIQGIAAIFLVAVLLYVRDLYTLGVVAVFSAVLFLLGRFGDSRVHLAVLWLLGSFSALYAIVDIGTDILVQGPFAGIAWLGGGTAFTNDAIILASLTWIPAFVWGVLWCALSMAIYIFNMYSLMIRRGR